MSLKGKILIHGQTETGRVRDHNEDAISHDKDIGLAILADGMGGHLGGEMASAITVGTVLEFILERSKKLNTGETDEETGYSAESMLVHQAVEPGQQPRISRHDRALGDRSGIVEVAKVPGVGIFAADAMATLCTSTRNSLAPARQNAP